MGRDIHHCEQLTGEELYVDLSAGGFAVILEYQRDSLLLRELTAEARKAEHCPSCFDRHASTIIRRLLTRTEPLPATEDHPT